MLKTIQLWWSGSWLVHNLEKAAVLFAAIWHNSWLGRLLGKPWHDTSHGDGGAGTPCRMGEKNRHPYFLYLVCALVAVGGVVGAILLPQGLTLLKWAALGIALALVWARPRVGVFAVAFLLPILPILSTSLLIAVAFVARLRQWQPLVPSSSLLRKLAGLFCLVGLFAALGSADTWAALRYWRYYLAGFLLLVLLMDMLRTQQDVEQVITWGLLSAILVSGLAIWQFVGGGPTDLSWVDIRVSAVMTRVTGTFDNPNMFAAYLVAWLPFPVARVLKRDLPFTVRLRNFFIAGLLGLALVLTSSRGGWVAFAASLFVMVACLQPRLFWGVPALLLAAPFILPPTIWQRLASIINLEDTSNMVRLYVWDSSAKMFLTNWILGIGQGLAPFARVYPIFQFGVVPALHAHSLLLQLAVEGGIFLLAIFLLICVAFWRLVMPNWRENPLHGVPLGAALLGHLVHGIFDHTWYDLRLMFIFWLLVGLASAVARQQLGEAK